MGTRPSALVVPVWLVVTVERCRYLESLAVDQARLSAVVATALNAEVPTCPGWSGADLAEHVAEVYLHKVECMRTGAMPSRWPPDRPVGEPVALLDRAYTALMAEFAARDDVTPAATWYEPDQTVGFWVRRMAQETLIHRIDAELAAGVPPASVPTDIAIDGIDELLVIFLSYATRCQPHDFVEVLPGVTQRVLLDAGERSWSVGIGPDGVEVEPGGGARADASIIGGSANLLRWLWQRAADDLVTVSGDPVVVDRFREAVGVTT